MKAPALGGAPMSAPSESRLRRQCLVCGKRIRQSGTGRPRLICTSRVCARARHLQLKPLAWSLEDIAEAKAAFRFSCAFCGRGDLPLRRSRYHTAPVPVCVHCAPLEAQLRAEKTAIARVAYFVANAKRGVPLPRPYQRQWEGKR